MNLEQFIEESKKPVMLLSLDGSAFREFDSASSVGRFLGRVNSSVSGAVKRKPKNKKYATVSHRTTKVKYFIKFAI